MLLACVSGIIILFLSTQGVVVVVNYDSWIYNHLFNQCLLTLQLWVRTPFMVRCTRYNIML